MNGQTAGAGGDGLDFSITHAAVDERMAVGILASFPRTITSFAIQADSVTGLTKGEVSESRQERIAIVAGRR